MKSTARSLHHVIKAAILLGFAMYIVHLVKSDSILYYIAPRMVNYVQWSSIGFYAMAVYEAYRGVSALWSKTPVCECDHEHKPPSGFLKNTLIYSLFVLPLALGFLLPDSTMGTSLAAKKGMNLSSSSTVKKDSAASSIPSANPSPSPNTNSGPSASSTNDAPKPTDVSDAKLDELFKADKFTEHYAKYAKKLYKQDIITVKEDAYIETLTTVDLYLDHFIGKKMELDGFVYRQDTMNDKQFVVGRFAIQCCSADAAPFGVLVEYDRANVLAADAWIHATGTLQKTTFNDTEVMVLKLEKFEKIEAPKTQYVYPNYEFAF